MDSYYCRQTERPFCTSVLWVLLSCSNMKAQKCVSKWFSSEEVLRASCFQCLTSDCLGAGSIPLVQWNVKHQTNCVNFSFVLVDFIFLQLERFAKNKIGMFYVFCLGNNFFQKKIFFCSLLVWWFLFLHLFVSFTESCSHTFFLVGRCACREALSQKLVFHR